MAGMTQDYPVRLEIDHPPSSSRLLAFCGLLFIVKALLLFPHIFVLYFVNLAAMFVVFICYLIVLFTGRYPEGMFNFVRGTLQWQTRLSAWLFGLTDRYPPFSLR